MTRNYLCTAQRIVLLSLIVTIVIVVTYQNLLTRSQAFLLPKVRLNPQRSLRGNATFKKVSIAHYTTTYGIRTDSNSTVFNQNLKQICEVLDPDDYPLADSVFVSIVDFVRFPRAYRHLHQSQLWIFHAEESPRNSYRSVEMNSITDLDDWFNLTSTLKPESDFHIQYRGYRIKPEIGTLLQLKFNINLTQPTDSPLEAFTNSSSPYLNNLLSILHTEFIARQSLRLNICPYTCNQPIPLQTLQSLQPHLHRTVSHVLNRGVVYIAWFVSNCNTHSRREEYVEKLRSQKGIRIDIFGHCKSVYHSPILPIQCRKGTPNCTEKTLSNYRFYLSFENSKCDTYITEKYWIQGTNGHAVPIVLGARKEEYRRIAIPNSYLHVDDFTSVEHLAEELHRLNRNDTEFSRYLQWTQLYDVSHRYSPTPAMDMHSALCFLGHYQHVHAMKDNNQQRQSAMARIRKIFNMTQVRLPNFNWTTAKTNLIRISQFYNPTVNCWDESYPSIAKRIYNHLFAWWKLF